MRGWRVLQIGVWGRYRTAAPPVDEVMNLADLAITTGIGGFTVKHFYSWYRRATQWHEELYMGKEHAADKRIGAKASGKGTQETATASALYWHDAASGRLPA